VDVMFWVMIFKSDGAIKEVAVNDIESRKMGG
jgi:hypothetical protein